MPKRILSNKAYPVVFLAVLVLITVSLLVWVNSFTAPVVEALRQARIKSILEEIYPDLTRYEVENEVFIIYSNDEVRGYAVLAGSNGYSGKISLLVGINTDGSIKDVSVISHTETPGLGSRITEKSFTDQFKGLDTEEIALSRDGGKIDAITGATISSEAVVEAVQESMIDSISDLK